MRSWFYNILKGRKFVSLRWKLWTPNILKAESFPENGDRGKNEFNLKFGRESYEIINMTITTIQTLMAFDKAGLFDTSVTMKGSGNIFLLSRLFIF